jgi:arabinose-5-phosphate isomerase
MNYQDEIYNNIEYYFSNINKEDIDKLSRILIDNVKNNIIIIGVGKSFNVGLEFCDLLRCINFSSFILEPSKILHGDLGVINTEDLVIIISNSGNTEELILIAENIYNNKNKNIILLSSKSNGKIKNIYNFIIPVKTELISCFSLIPTNSYLNFIIFFNNIISTIISKLQLNNSIYKENHNKGNISKFFQKISNFVIPKEKCSIQNPDNTIKDLIISMNRYCTGCTIIINNDKIEGIVTDKDLRIYLRKSNNLLEKVSNIMNTNFFYLEDDILLKDIEKKKTQFLHKNKIISEFEIIPVVKNTYFHGLYLVNKL